MGKKRTGVRIKVPDLEELERLAKEDDETVSFLIRQAKREFLDRRRKTTK
jgi:predicted transcriptional regulator